MSSPDGRKRQAEVGVGTGIQDAGFFRAHEQRDLLGGGDGEVDDDVRIVARFQQADLPTFPDIPGDTDDEMWKITPLRIEALHGQVSLQTYASTATFRIGEQQLGCQLPPRSLSRSA